MKKKSIVLIFICLALLVLTGCGGKKAITTIDFVRKVEGLGYVSDAIEQFLDYTHITEATIARYEDNFQAEFFVLDSVEEAKGMFDANKTIFEGYKGTSSTESSVDMSNYTTYDLTTGEYYMHLCRVDNTLLYVKVKIEYKDSIKKLIKELGY